MADKSLLVALANLRRLDNKVFVTENLLTRAFVYLLNNDQAVFKGYLNKLGVPYSPGLSARDQDTFGENTPDMQIGALNQDVFVLQENKINSPEGYRQRPKYLAIFRGISAKHKLFVYVEPRKTKVALPTKQAQGVHQKFLTWDEIAEVVESAPAARGRQRWVREELLDFMKERKMISPPPLNVSELTRARQALEQQQETLERIFQEAKNSFTTSSTEQGVGSISWH